MIATFLVVELKGKFGDVRAVVREKKGNERNEENYFSLYLENKCCLPLNSSLHMNREKGESISKKISHILSSYFLLSK